MSLGALMFASEVAHKRGARLAAVVGDTTPESERAWNKLGRVRLYRQSSESETSLRGVPFWQPSLSFNYGTGELPERNFAKLHLMMQRFGQPLTPEFAAAVTEHSTNGSLVRLGRCVAAKLRERNAIKR